MTTEAELEIEKITEESVLEVLRNKKLKPEVKAKTGMEYLRHKHGIRMDNLSAVATVARLYPEYRREDFAKKIIPPKYEVIDTDFEVIPKVTLQEVFQAKNELAKEKQEESERAQKAENRLADLTDEKTAKDKAKLVEIAKQEYQQKRDY